MSSSDHTENLGHTRVDLDREDRTGSPEIIYAAGKTPSQLCEIIESFQKRGENCLATRVQEEAFAVLRERFPTGLLDELSCTFRLRSDGVSSSGSVAILCAGTSDLSVAEEAAVTCEFYGYGISRFSDVGVAGLHRLLDVIDDVRQADVVIVVAGMEGALPSVVGGLVKTPVIAVPTSVGYGANFSGLSALLGMLNSCSSGLTVVNIDNGFGAAAAAHRILLNQQSVR